MSTTGTLVQIKIRHAVLKRKGLSGLYVRASFFPASANVVTRRTARRGTKDQAQVTWNEVMEMRGAGDVVLLEIKEDKLLGHNDVVGRCVILVRKDLAEDEYTELVLPASTLKPEDLISRCGKLTDEETTATIYMQVRVSFSKTTFAAQSGSQDKVALLKNFLDSPSEVFAQGWLTKRSPAWPHMYQQRWCCVKGHLLAYCPPSPNFLEPPVDVPLLAVVDIKDCVFTRHPTDLTKFSLDGPHLTRNGADSVYVFKAETATLRDKWQDAFLKARGALDEAPLPEMKSLLDLIGEEEIRQTEPAAEQQQQERRNSDPQPQEEKVECSECGKEIVDDQYVEIKGLAGHAKLHDACVTPYKIRTRPKCFKCGEPILDAAHVVIGDEHYHDPCAPPE